MVHYEVMDIIYIHPYCSLTSCIIYHTLVKFHQSIITYSDDPDRMDTVILPYPVKLRLIDTLRIREYCRLLKKYVLQS